MASLLQILEQSRKLIYRINPLEEISYLLYDSADDDPGRFFMFGTQRNLDMLVDNGNWFVDGTFKVAPHLFYQVHTIHEHSVLPMLYVVLQSKREEDHTRGLQLFTS